jgi:hypothetical protein
MEAHGGLIQLGGGWPILDGDDRGEPVIQVGADGPLLIRCANALAGCGDLVGQAAVDLLAGSGVDIDAFALSADRVDVG